MMKRLFSLGIFCIALFSMKAQDGQYIHRHLCRATLTIAPGIPTSGAAKNIYLHGDIEYYLDSLISLRGDGFYSIRKNIDIRQQHSSFAGASFHIPTKNHFDPYIGIGAGLGIIQSRIFDSDTGNVILPVPAPVYDKLRYNPMYSAVVGFNFYAQQYFHFFGEMRYAGGTHYPAEGQPVSLNELRISFGLGWNLF